MPARSWGRSDSPRTSRAIRRHDRLATLGEVAIGVAHEINNPLEVIVNNLNLVEKHVARVSSDEDFIIESERFDSTYGAIARIQHIVNKLNDLARGHRVRDAPVPARHHDDRPRRRHAVAADGGLDRAGRRARSRARRRPHPGGGRRPRRLPVAARSAHAGGLRRAGGDRGAARASRSSTPRRSTWC